MTCVEAIYLWRHLSNMHLIWRIWQIIYQSYQTENINIELILTKKLTNKRHVSNPISGLLPWMLVLFQSILPSCNGNPIYLTQRIEDGTNCGNYTEDIFKTFSCIESVAFYRQVFNISSTQSQHLKDARTVLRLSLPFPWSQVLSREWRCSWSSADTSCIRGLPVVYFWSLFPMKWLNIGQRWF